MLDRNSTSYSVVTEKAQIGWVSASFRNKSRHCSDWPVDQRTDMACAPPENGSARSRVASKGRDREAREEITAKGSASLLRKWSLSRFLCEKGSGAIASNTKSSVFDTYSGLASSSKRIRVREQGEYWVYARRLTVSRMFRAAASFSDSY